MAVIVQNYNVAFILKYSVAVFCVFVARLLDIPQFNPNASSSTYVTMHQMMGFFEEKAGDLPEYLLTLAGECTFNMM